VCTLRKCAFGVHETLTNLALFVCKLRAVGLV
jgi:hypothetical protein